MKPHIPTSAPTSTKARFAQTELQKMPFVARILLIAFLFALASPVIAQQQKIDSLLKVLENTKVDTTRVTLLHRISKEYLLTNSYKVIEYEKQGLILSKKIGYKKGQSICLHTLGQAYDNIGKFDTALVFYEKRLMLAKELKDSIGIAKTFNNMGIIYLHYGETKKAIDLTEMANRIYASRDEKSLLAIGYSNIGNIYLGQAENAIALDYYLKACKLYQEDNNENGIGNPLLNICSIYTEMKQYEKAKQYALEANTKFVKTNNIRGIGIALQKLAVVYNEEGDFENAIKYLNKAKVIFDEMHDSYNQGLVNQALGAAFHELGENRKALDNLNMSLLIAKKIGDSQLISTLYGNLGDVYSENGDFQKALEYMHKSEQMLQENNDKFTLLQISMAFIVLYARMNQPDSVKKYLEKYKQLQDTIYSEQTTKAIAEMQTKYETEKKDKEILALNLDVEKKKNTVWAIASGAVLLLVVSGSGFAVFSNKKRREQAVLQQTISETDMKALRSQMNPHFIFNCIHTINGLLNGLKIQESKACLDQFSNLTRSVLENSKKREIPLSDELETLRLYMDLENMRFANPFQYTLTIETGIDPETTLVPPLILQPFVENSIKHGFCDPEKAGKLKIEIRTENDCLICMVEDNGIGRTNTINVKPVSGFKKESLGIKLTEERLDLIRRTKKVKSHFSIKDLVDGANNPAGTLVEMVLPYELSV